MYELLINDGGALDRAPHTRGAREHLSVSEGAGEVTRGGSVERLKARDTSRYAADVTHAIRAVDGPVRAFLVVQNA